MATGLKGRNFRLISVALIIIVSTYMSTSGASVSLQSINTVIPPPCNGTIGNCIHDEDLLIENEAERRSLQSTAKRISYAGLSADPVCNAEQYGNCIVPIGKGNRGCTAYNRCKRALSR